MRQASRLLPWLALACVLGVACAKAEPAIIGLDSSSSSNSRELLQASGSTQTSKPGCVCPMHYQPVCCIDGHTYGNACTARCKGAKIAHKGECQPSSVKMETMSQDAASSSSSSSPSVSSANITNAVKKGPCFCAKMYAPVCSKDQKTFGNACEAKCAGVEVSHTGPCLDSSSASTVTSTTQVPAPSSESAACQCDATVKGDVCGEDGKTYTNECFADCAGAKVVTQGACKPKPKCHAPCWWPYKPVCGKDGKTYANECRAACKGIEIVSQGGCRVRGKNGGWFGRKPACVCTANYDPVCGKNNKTYSNSCEADCEGISVSHKGECEPAEAKTSSNSTASKDVGSCVCPMVWKPVCTKNGKTRGNKCEAKCRGETIVQEGECDAKGTAKGEQVKSTASLSAESADDSSKLPSAGVPMKPPRKPDCVCVQLWAPVCGKDGNTYSNKCEAKCHDMTVVREGECETTSTVDGATLGGRATGVLPGCNVCPAVFAPVCGKDGRTYGNDCEAACRGKTTVAYEGRCKGDKGGEAPTGISGLDRCLEGCTASNKPVCGVDRKRYRSACAAHCHKVDIAYPGDCNPECSACPHTWFPYCANSPQYGPATFANCCFAKCNNVPIIKSVLHAGVCLDKCGKCDPTLERPLCCKGRTYKNGCYASCSEEDTSQCSQGRCSSTAHVDEGLGCLLGPCQLQCSGDKYDQPVCGSDGNTYPSQCSLMCSQKVAIVHKGKCGTCAPNQLPGGFPFCAAGDRTGVSTVCGKNGVTYRNSIAAGAASVEVASTGTCPGSQCGQENEVCFVTGGEQSSCCTGYTCTPDSSVKVETSLAEKVMGGAPGVCKKVSATLSA